MRAKLAILLFGIAIGYCIRFIDPHEPASHSVEQNPQSQLLVSKLESQPEVPAPRALTRSSPIESETQRKSESSTEPAQIRPRSTRETSAPQDDATTQKLLISEELVAEMEREQESLRNFAYTEQTSDGWRILISDQDQIFGRAGFASGDVITYSSLNQSATKALASRMASILSSLQR